MARQVGGPFLEASLVHQSGARLRIDLARRRKKSHFVWAARADFDGLEATRCELLKVMTDELLCRNVAAETYTRVR